MTRKFEPVADDLLRAKLNSETAKFRWSELQRFFAAGQTLFVAADLDLIDVACAFSHDNSAQVKCWLQQELISPVSDTQARDWISQDSMLWTIVVRPWVLIQLLR